MTIEVKISADSFDLTPAPNYFELRDSMVRLRPHDADGNWCGANFPLTDNSGLAGESAYRYMDTNYNIEATARYGMVSVTPSIKFGSYSAKFIDLPAGITMPLDEVRFNNLLIFSFDVWYRPNQVTGSGIIAGEYGQNISGYGRWALVRNLASLEFWTVNDAGTTDKRLCAGLTLVAGSTVHLRVTFDGSGADGSCAATISVDGVRYDTGAQTCKKPQTLDTYTTPPLIMGQTMKASATLGLTWVVPYNDPNMGLCDFQFYPGVILSHTYIPPVDAFTPYETLQSGVVVTLDSGSFGSIWNNTTFDVDDTTQWAAAVGNYGYTLKYEFSDAPTGAWSAEMTRAQFIAVGAGVGRYLKLQLICRSNGIQNYSLKYISCSTRIVGPSNPQITALNRTGTTGTATINVATGGGTLYLYAIPIFGDATNFPYLNSDVVGSVASVAGDNNLNFDLSTITELYYTRYGVTIDMPMIFMAGHYRDSMLSINNPKYFTPSMFTAGTVTISNISRALDGLSADVTITDAGAGDTVLIGYNVGSALLVQKFTGPGTYTISGLVATETFSPWVIGLTAGVQFYGGKGLNEARSIRKPGSVDNEGPHSEDL